MQSKVKHILPLHSFILRAKAAIGLALLPFQNIYITYTYTYVWSHICTHMEIYMYIHNICDWVIDIVKALLCLGHLDFQKQN